MVFWILLWSKPHSEHFCKLRGLREVPSAASPLLLRLYQNNSIFWCKKFPAHEIWDVLTSRKKFALLFVIAYWLFQSPTLSYIIMKSPKIFIAVQKSLRVLQLLRVLIIGSSIRFSLLGPLKGPRWEGPLWVLSARLFFRGLSDRFFSWVISSLFFQHAAIFSSKHAFFN